MLKLHAANLTVYGNSKQANSICRLIVDPTDGYIPGPHDSQLLRAGDILLPGYQAYFAFENWLGSHEGDGPIIFLPVDFDYLQSGDVIRLMHRNNAIRVLFRTSSSFNSFLLTERCNNYCLMCSQPPKLVEDSWLIEEIFEVISLLNSSVKEIGLSGGEPSLYGADLVRLIEAFKTTLPETALHMLSNGRRFSDEKFARALGDVKHPDFMIGVPLYSDVASRHDHVVQALGGFDEAVRGIVNLKRYGVRVEIRVVLHKLTTTRLRELAEFITRNLLFVDHVALMGLEMTGLTRANLSDLWIDPIEYGSELADAALWLSSHGIRTSIYNQQLCVTPRSVWHLCKRSISDWKNEYMDECDGCQQRSRCAGFFSSAKLKYSSYIRPLAALC